MSHSRRSSSYPALTRRRFLEQLGAVGGSSLVFSTLTSWDLMAGSAGQKPALTGKPAKSKVVVLGAGLSGMVVGYELGKLGYDFQILEARERVGGLQWAVRKGSEHTEVGAVASRWARFQQREADLAAGREMLAASSDDADMAAMAQEEIDSASVEATASAASTIARLSHGEASETAKKP